ncbi:tetratricopeptide repeat-containing sensor histidine kinase [Polaribacter septentrionalilitoris]|uniref:tetratricopeptide repeat-containing sensor histidine kinase n=1 Tax=Polaribacter septentrionalilitoris TaxID=2494657 RepID=UPI001F4790F7|nr:histidine kinase [Polaribacter septentrionalilitoris]
MMTLKNSLTYFLFFFILGISAQENSIAVPTKTFEVKVVVEDKSTGNPIKNADIFAGGSYYNYSPISSNYIIKAKVGDEIRVTHPDFDTVYYTIKSDEEIRVLVEDFYPKTKPYKSNQSSRKKLSKESDFYHKYLDSAKFYKKIDIDKSLSFVEKSLEKKNSRQRNSASYKVLADVYLYWKQYDLAVNNYKLSLQIKTSLSTKIALAKAQFLLRDYSASETTFSELLKENLSNYEKITVLEGLGDVHFVLKKYNSAKTYFNEALDLAKKNSVTPKITDLNSKLADVFAAEGNIQQANSRFQNSLNLAAKENVNRALKEEEKVADFYNSNRRFDDEIKLRKESLLKTKQNKLSSKKSRVNDSITSQKINYKIGNAYILKEDYKEAIPFLQQSIQDADKKKDIIVEKDATRKLSEVYATVGEYDKALKSYEDYVKLVDESYIQKEQEIQQVKRFSKKISDNQNRIASLEKDKELAESRMNLAYIDQKLSEESNQRQRIIIYSLFGGFLLMCLLAYFMFRNIKQQKLTNNLLALKSMRSQMNPHFIFNALNSVNSFIAVNDERNANRYLSEFSILMRSVLENSDEDFIPLHKEIELLELYVKLEHNRFKEKFEYQIDIDETINLEDFSIPPMLLQPYIENAIWHGLRYKKEKGKLEILIHKKDKESVVISIIDDGIGRKKSEELKTKNQLKQKSKGMSTIKNRIAILNDMYKERISVSVFDLFENGEGTKVELLLKKK